MPRGNQGGGSPSRGNNMEARLAELQDTLARLVAASAQPTLRATGSGASTSSGAPRLPHETFEYGAVGQVISAVATRSQTEAPEVPTIAVDPLGRVTQGARHKGPVDGIGQSRLPMTFGLADVAANLPQGTPSGNDTEEGVVKSLALKVLQVPLFSGAQCGAFLCPPQIFRGQEVENEPPHNEPRERGEFAFCLDHLLLILITLSVWITQFAI